MNATSIAAIVAAAIILLMLFYFRNKLSAFLKDSSTIPDPSQRTYSLAKTILAFWTFIILFSICYIAIACGYLPPLTQNVLILMGIAVGTTTAGTTIDTLQEQDNNIVRAQDIYTKQGFLTDILSDANGISIHRFQAVMFNIVYGASFIAIVVSEYRLLDFPQGTLALLGISSGTYALLKVAENTTTPPTSPPMGH